MSSFQQQIYEQLDKLDEQLADKSKSERQAFGLFFGAVFAVLVYFAVYDMSSGYRIGAEGRFNDINGKLNTEKEYIASMDNGGFLNLENEIARINTNIEQSNTYLAYLQGLQNEIFDESKKWFFTIDEASKMARNMGLNLNKTQIDYNDEANLGGMKNAKFILNGYGKYENIMRYIDWLETFGKFIAIDGVIMQRKDTRLEFEIIVRNFKGGA